MSSATEICTWSMWFAVPEGLEDGVAEAQSDEVLHRLLAEVVVDAEDLAARRNTRCKIGVERVAAREIVAEGLLDDDPRVAGRVGGIGDEAGLREAVVDHGEQARRDGEVVDAIAAGAVRAVELLELRAQPQRSSRRRRSRPTT